MLRKALLSLLVPLALSVAPAAAADGPMLVTQGGAGVVNASGTLRYAVVGVAGSTGLEVIRTNGGGGMNWGELPRSWGLPVIGSRVEGVFPQRRPLGVRADNLRTTDEVLRGLPRSPGGP